MKEGRNPQAVILCAVWSFPEKPKPYDAAFKTGIVTEHP